MKKVLCLILCLSVFQIVLTGCSNKTNDTGKSADNDKTVAEYNVNGDESLINSENLELFEDVAQKANNTSDEITLPIVVNENKEITDYAKVKLLSAKYEEGEIKSFTNLSDNYTTIFHYDNYFNNDGLLNDNYVFVELTLSITSEKTWEDIRLSSFKLQYVYNGQYGSCEPKFIDNCIDFNDPHKRSAIIIKSDDINEIKIGYIISRQEFENIDDAYLHAQFSTFSIDGSGSLKIESIEKN